MLQNISEGAQIVGPTIVNKTSFISGMIYACTHSDLNHCSSAGGAAYQSHLVEHTQNHTITSGGQHAEMQEKWKEKEKITGYLLHMRQSRKGRKRKIQK